MSLIPKTYDVARPIMHRLLKKWKWLRYMPIFSRYAEGGDLNTPEKAEETQHKWEEGKK